MQQLCGCWIFFFFLHEACGWVRFVRVALLNTWTQAYGFGGRNLRHDKFVAKTPFRVHIFTGLIPPWISHCVFTNLPHEFLSTFIEWNSQCVFAYPTFLLTQLPHEFLSTFILTPWISQYVFTYPMDFSIRFLYILIIHTIYIALFSALEQTHCAHWHVILNEWLYPFIARII